MTIRKNFLFDEKIAKHLEEIALMEGKTQTQAIQEAVEEKYKQININKKLSALNELAGSFSGMLTDINTKKIPIERAVHRAK